MRLARDQREAGVLIDLARGDQDALGPQRDPLVALLARGADALLDQRAPDAKAARVLLHQQQPQLGDVVGGLHQEDRADRLAVASAIQQCSREASKVLMNCAPISATSASKLMSQPYSSA